MLTHFVGNSAGLGRGSSGGCSPASQQSAAFPRRHVAHLPPYHTAPGNPCAVTSKEGAAIERDSSAYFLAARAGALSPGCEKDSSVTIFIHLANHRPATFGLCSGTFVGLFGQLITSTRSKERRREERKGRLYSTSLFPALSSRIWISEKGTKYGDVLAFLQKILTMERRPMSCLVHTPRLFLPPALLSLRVIAIEVMDGSSSKLKDSITTLPEDNSLNVSDAFPCFRACQTSSAVVFGEIE